MKSNSIKLLTGFAVVMLICVIAFVALAEKPDKPEGNPNVGDRVIYFSDDDGNGFFERNVAIVADDTNITALIEKRAPEFGQEVVLWVFPSEQSTKTTPYRVHATRGRTVGEYEALVTSNH